MSNSNNDISRLLKTKADVLFSSLLSDSEKEQIERLRIKKAEKKKKLTGEKTKSTLIDVKESDFVIRGGAVDELGNIIDDFDVARYMSEMEDPETGTLHDLKIDLRDLPKAKNYYDYCFRLSGKKIHAPWSRQLWIGAMLHGEICPVCSDKKWLDILNVPKDYPSINLPDKLCFLDHGVCPKCKRGKYELIKNHGLADYIQLCSVIGQRGGKSSSFAHYASYDLHRVLMFPKYSDLTKSMQASTEMTGTFVSLSASKAIGVMWTPFRKITTEDSAWFKEYFAALDYYKQLYGRELYRSSTIYQSYGLKNVKFYPSGPRSSTLRGDTRIVAALDELGLFPLPTGDAEEDENSERANADEAHKSLYNSLTTVNLAYNELLRKGYNTAPPALLYNVSSPISQRDKMMRLLRESKTEEGRKYILGVNLPTWEINPFMSRDTPVIAAAYASNPEKAERDFGANPPAVQSRFIPTKMIEKGIFINGDNSHRLIYQFDQEGTIYGKLEKARNFKYPSLVAIDAGSVNNSFSIVGGHYNFDTGKTVITTLLECVPQQGRRVDFNLLYENVILRLCRDLNAIGLVADQWQSIDLLQRIKQDMGNNPKQKPRTVSKQYSLKRKDFESFRSILESKNLVLPTIPNERLQYIIDGNVVDYKTEMVEKPVDHLALQMITISDIGETRCPEKGQGYTDDILRALVLLVTIMHGQKCMDRMVEAKDWTYEGVQSAAMPKPVFLSRGGFRYPGLR